MFRSTSIDHADQDGQPISNTRSAWQARKNKTKINYVTVEQEVSSGHSHNASLASEGNRRWLPQSLSPVYLLVLTIVSLFLGVCCLALVAYSQVHDGIADAGSSGGFKFNQRFLPTLIAVLYTLLWAPVVVDVIRTEPWALLSLPAGSKAAASLLQNDKMWWMYLVEALRNRKRPGGIRWGLFLAVSASMISSIVINPLSAGLADTSTYIVRSDRQFTGIMTSETGEEYSQIGDITYLRAVANLQYNVSTSAWSTDQYTVAPFWPTDMTQAPMTASLARTPQIWVGNRDVYSLKLECRPFTSKRNSSLIYRGPELVTDDGCAVMPGRDSWGSWGQINNDTSPFTLANCLAKGYRDYFVFISNGENDTTETLVPEKDVLAATYYNGQACKTSYLAANLPVNVSTTSLGTAISFDKEAFERSQHPMDAHRLNISEFEKDFVLQTGSNHLRPTSGVAYYHRHNGVDPNADFKGPALVLASGYNYSVSTLIKANADEMAQRAAIIKQRFLGEVLLTSFNKIVEINRTESLPGAIIEQRTRLTMDLGLGVTVGVLFLLLAVCALGLLFIVSPTRRPLHLLADPNKASTAAQILSDTDTCTKFDGLDRVAKKDMHTAIGKQQFLMKDGTLLHIEDPTSQNPATTNSGQSSSYSSVTDRNKNNQKVSNDWRPFSLKRKSGSLLAILLASVLVALSAVYAVSLRRPLYQAAFVYESEIRLGKLNVTTLAPYSIIPTIVAVAIKLWWGTIDSSHRRLAPFVAMAKAPVPLAVDAAHLTFVSTPVLYITVKAFHKRYWMLALVTFGTLMAEVLQISMSALWDREQGLVEFNVDLVNQYELRTIPHVFENAAPPPVRSVESISYPTIAQHLYGGRLYQSSWIYAGLAELTFGASPPAWTKDEWNFPPMNLTGITKNLPKAALNSSGTDLGPSTNITFDSTGIRGRTECSSVDTTWSNWMVEVKNFTGLRPYLNESNAKLPNITSGFELLPEVRIRNFTQLDGSAPSVVAIGQWLHSNYSSNSTRGLPLYSGKQSQNFTILWIEAGSPYRFKPTMYNGDKFEKPPRMIFAQRPTIQAINCRPIFETAKARIKVNARSGKIEEHSLSESAKPMPGAWSNAFDRHFSNETDYMQWMKTTIDDKTNMNLELPFNSTVSLGYLFQLALLQASNNMGRKSDPYDTAVDLSSDTPFSFVEPDLYSDPFSYASLARAGYNRTALLNSTILTDVSQEVFSTFFRWFVSSKSGYEGEYWAYQKIGTKLQSGLDFGPTESLIVSSSTTTRTDKLCSTTKSEWTKTITTEGETYTKEYAQFVCPFSTRTTTVTSTTVTSFWRIADTRPVPSSSGKSASYTGRYFDDEDFESSTGTRVSASASASASPSRAATSTPRPTPSSSPRVSASRSLTPTLTPTPTPTPTLTPSSPARNIKRQTTATPNTIRATLQIPTSTLVISRTALFLSITILAILIVSTAIIYTVQNAHLRLLPRDFDSPASLLAAVYASEELKRWAGEEYGRRQRGGEMGAVATDDVHVGMGYFRGRDGKERWGIEVQETTPLVNRNGTEIREVPIQESTPMISGQGWENRI